VVSTCKRKNIPEIGPIIQEKALKISKLLKLDDFKVTNGWLQNFIKMYNIKNFVISGELKSANFDYVEKFLRLT
jgi:hypothetical protein